MIVKLALKRLSPHKYRTIGASFLGCVDELLDTDPCGYQVNESEKRLAQFVIARRNPTKLLETAEKAFDFLTQLVLLGI